MLFKIKEEIYNMDENVPKPITEDSRIRMKYYDHYATGNVIRIRRNDETGIHEAKILFDGEFDLAYDYYPLKDLESIDETQKDT